MKTLFLDSELERYSRNFLISSWGNESQKSLKHSLVIFADYVEVAARYLLAAGVGNVMIADEGVDKPTIKELASLNSDSRVYSASTEGLAGNSYLKTLIVRKDKNELQTNSLISGSYAELVFSRDNISLLEEGKILRNIESISALDQSRTAIGINLSLLAIKHLLPASD